MTYDYHDFPEMLSWPEASEDVMDTFQKSEAKGRVLHLDEGEDLTALDKLIEYHQHRQGCLNNLEWKNPPESPYDLATMGKHEAYVRCERMMNQAYYEMRKLVSGKEKWAKWLLNPEAVNCGTNWLDWRNMRLYVSGRLCRIFEVSEASRLIAATYIFPSAEEQKDVGQLLREMHTLMEQVVLQKPDRSDAIRRKYGAFEVEALK